ncbi:MAG: diacylglycerol kinase family lipid kinase [Muribaculaceae bacterium]|nr:diacylglycerol kinase family lipid kinase [Muribaculaceae bacterium]
MENYLLIINPISGTGSKEGLAQYVVEHLSDTQRQVHVAYTTAGGDATRLARKAADNGFAAVIAAGGDGTVNETATALCDTGVALGILPMGSGNGLARHLGIPIDPAEALNIIASHNILDCDYCTVNNRPFFCTFGVGFDAAVSEKFARQKKRGKLSYIRSAISEYVSYNPQVYTISANGHIITQKAFIVACCNASQYGNNAYIAPKASITDGMMDITIIHAGGTPLDTAIMGVDLFTGYINRNTLIRTFRTQEATIIRSGIGPAHIDGEPVTMEEEMKVICKHCGLRIFTPGETHVRPIITPITSALDDIRTSLGRIFRPNHIG